MMKIDEIMNRLQEQQPAISNPDELTDRIMDSLPDLAPEQSKPARSIRLYIVSAIAAAASILLLLTLYQNNDVETMNQPIVVRQTEQQKSKPKVVEREPMPMAKEEKPLVTKAITVVKRPEAATTVHKTTSTVSTTDSLEYYIDKIERELAQVDESLYIERMNKVIRADERLQRMVNSYILHNLDKEGRPQTADNMYNVKSEQDEE